MLTHKNVYEKVLLKLLRESNAQLQQLKRDIDDAFGDEKSSQSSKASDAVDDTDTKKKKSSTKTATSSLDVSLLTPGFKLKNKNSGVLYTVKSINGEQAFLKTPEGKRVSIDAKKLRTDYERA